MLADKVDYEPLDPASETGTLKVTGYIRGSALSANRLVHIQDLGDFQMDQILSCPIETKERLGMAVDSAQLLHASDPAAQESLVTENEPDPMDAEQTWPTDEEMGLYADDTMDGQSEGAASTKKTRRVPKGTSSYQAAWIVDDEPEGGEDEDEDEDLGDEDDLMMDEEIQEMHDEKDPTAAGDLSDDEEYEEIELEDKETAFDATVNAEHEEEALKEYLERKKQSQEDMQFPDEVDTPQHTPARVRFQKYRGLKSFRTSAWDPYENLPVDYARIFQFQNFKRSKKRIFDMIGMDGVPVGTYVTICIKDVPKKVLGIHSSIIHEDARL
jgi:pre-rRNA-processing protein TSR1